jgi:hypothetical protein
MKRAMPTSPSLPAIAISADEPSFVTERSETMQSVGKYT